MKFSWTKRGLLYEPNIPGFSHGSHPAIAHISGDEFILAFTARDADQRSHVFLSTATVQNGAIELHGKPKLALRPGQEMYFDCDGAVSGCIVPWQGRFYLYYVGWQNLSRGGWICDTGRAILDVENLTLEREFLGPVLGRDRRHPLFLAATAYCIDPEGLWHCYYNSGLSWEKTDDGWHHVYGLHHATSRNGLDWDYIAGMAIPFADENEYAFGRPSVVDWDGMFYMWFAHRGSKGVPAYRMGFASSEDGYHWDRDDAAAGIDVSEEGWDSEMICYPCVFRHKGKDYMLYNGNDYGKTGFGYAILDDYTPHK